MSNTSQITAGIVAPPPLIYLGALLVGFIAQYFSPQYTLSYFPARPLLGILLLIFSATFARWAFVSMREIGTSGNPREPTTALVVNGPFQLSRNPIYLAMTGMYLGISLLANALWLLLLIVPVLFVMHWGVILREEQYLAKQFGATYATYKSKVRRWI